MDNFLLMIVENLWFSKMENYMDNSWFWKKENSLSLKKENLSFWKIGKNIVEPYGEFMILENEYLQKENLSF